MTTSDASSSSRSGDTERIAPVTYLFGAAPAQAAPVPEQAAAFEEEEPASEFTPELTPEPVRESKLRARPEGNFDPVSNVSMYALARRDMSSKEMRDYLIRREFEESVVDEEIARLERVELLSDDRLAETLVRTLRDRKGLGRGGLTAELRRRNVDSSAIEAAMGDVGDDELARATEIAIKRAPQLRGLDQQTAKRRLGAFLMRKGYQGSVVSGAVAAALNPSGATSSGPTFR